MHRRRSLYMSAAWSALNKNLSSPLPISAISSRRVASLEALPAPLLQAPVNWSWLFCELEQLARYDTSKYADETASRFRSVLFVSLDKLLLTDLNNQSYKSCSTVEDCLISLDGW